MGIIVLSLLAAFIALCAIRAVLCWLARNAANIRVKRFAWCVLYVLDFFSRDGQEPWEAREAAFRSDFGPCP
jgi:hypothetical protein